MKTARRQDTSFRIAMVVLSLAPYAAPMAGQEIKPQGAALVGRWESVTRSQGGIGTTVEFAPGGILIETPGAMVDDKYRVAGDTALLDIGPGQYIRFFFRRDTLFMQGSGDKPSVPPPSVALRRLSAPEPGQPRLVGRWSLAATDTLAPSDPARAAFAKARYEFTADGRSRLRIPFRSDTSSYRLSGDTLVIITSPGSGAREVRALYTLADSTLTLVQIVGGVSGQFRRVP